MCRTVCGSLLRIMKESIKYTRRVGQELHDYLMKDWRAQKAENIRRQQLGENAYVALLDGKVVGFAAFRLEGEMGVIANNAVDQNYRGTALPGCFTESFWKK